MSWSSFFVPVNRSCPSIISCIIG
ncbi:unnamed protein product [Spirodela intermedia]|uniref:Uncharacterized protein n=2 Tax=Spirodela intermedia TaxID=51605 RepID=A0A7I8LKH0_SPIIN|nr:unnamed protein product [Spirodela intermedia]CAA6673085.1 unnamed protein product [Spirodela intermedia]CAA7410300.1 unnamed protein product [Spirodela intermedia]